MKDDCLFCKIIKGEIPSKCLYEDDDIKVILDAFPDTDGHTLVIPKMHYKDIYDVPDDVLIKMTKVGREYAQKLMKTFNKNALTFVINYGEAQAIKHIHLHLLPDFMHKSKTLTPDEAFAKITKE